MWMMSSRGHLGVLFLVGVAGASGCGTAEEPAGSAEAPVTAKEPAGSAEAPVTAGPVGAAIDMDRFEKGWFGVSPATLHMQTGETRSVRVSAGLADLRKLVEYKLAETGRFTGKDIALGTRLHIQLEAQNPENFIIKPPWPGMEDQDILRNEVTTWEFNVTAKQAGHKQQLLVKAWSTMDRSGKPIPPMTRDVRDVATLTVDVDVESFWGRFKATATWLVSILAGIAALYGAWRKIIQPHLAHGPSTDA